MLRKGNEERSLGKWAGFASQKKQINVRLLFVPQARRPNLKLIVCFAKTVQAVFVDERYDCNINDCEMYVHECMVDRVCNCANGDVCGCEACI